jgi:hypothetical protein
MSVVNVKVKYIRPEYENLKEWMEDSNNVYIGRKGIIFIDGKRFPQNNSIFANPFKISKDETREQVIDKYEDYIREIINNDANIKSELLALKNKNLGCWCAPEPCHGHVLLNLISEFT